MRRFARREAGSGFIGILVILAIFAMMAFVGFKFLMLRVHYASLREIARSCARFAISYSDNAIQRDIKQRAFENGIALETDSIYVYREPGYRITIQFSFSDSVNVLVKTFYYRFSVDESAPLPR